MEVIPATVYAIAFDEKNIFARQHPWKYSLQPDQTITNYFILPMKDTINWNTNNGLLGPLSEEQCIKKCKDLGIKKRIKFTSIFQAD